MHSNRVNISLIQKYLAGELDARAMHQLEMQALDDPFLMDAIEGYGSVKADQQLNLDDLSQRLQKRTREERGFVIPWKVWPIAASVLMVLTIGGLYVRRSANNQLKPEKNIAANNALPPAPVAGDTIKKADTTKATLLARRAPKFVVPVHKAKSTKPLSNSIYQQEISAGDKVANNVAPAANSGFGSAPPPASDTKANYQYDTKPDVSLDERVAFGYMSSAKKDSAAQNLLGLRAKTTKTSSAPALLKLQGKVDGVISTPAPGYSGKNAAESRYIAGTIISRNDGSPLIGAAIRIKGTNRSTVTDVNGKFSLSSPVDNATLDVAYIGYQRRQVNATRGDSVKIALAEDGNALSEVVVVGHKQDDDDGDAPAAIAAHPQLGWGGLKKYLQANAVMPDGTTGTVTVMFTVFPSGIIDEFGIKKGLNEAVNQKAIELIRNGPAWTGNSNHKPEQVTVKVKFRKQQQ
ncbi:carboxypeptidase-like protein [Mucilaginibacter oryzae]|uniref:Carboxypeptidase-like protein n=1 Tax=Mucilaginibacter oryzae TaxID=468058 RepID=A0A316H1I5_9SPHI|nr:carboxypeptidase-like regulatory domain-containing protein [Mucilaginibacter oryzae]PWK71442.1 carboxypeptidase-like protein [Mucilaginibacter oryzae]